MYRILLRLYPADYHARFAVEMTAAFRNGARDVRRQGPVEFARFLIVEMSGLFTGAAKEWTAKLTSSSLARARSLPDLRKMRPAGISREAWFGGPHSR